MLTDLFKEEEDSDEGATVSSTSKSGKGPSLPKPPDRRGQSGFVGLQNQGATCYMNSLLQAMYMTPELRHGLFEVDPLELGYSPDQASKDDKIQAIGTGEPVVNQSIVSELINMGFDQHGSRRAVIATKSTGVDDALTYYFAHCDDKGFTDPPAQSIDEKAAGTGKKKKKPRLIPLELQRLFSQLQLLDIDAQSTTDLTSKGFQWQGADGSIQHDAHELSRLLLDALEKSLKHTTGEKLCASLYRGTLHNRLRCLECNTVRDRDEDYFDLMTQVLECPNLAKSMRAYLAAEVLEGPNALNCEVCGKRCSTHKGTVLTDPLPPILSFSLQRFGIDRTTWQRVKLKDAFEFPLVVDMDMFISPDGLPGFDIHAPISSDSKMEDEMVKSIHGRMVWLKDAIECAKRHATVLVDSAFATAVASREDNSSKVSIDMETGHSSPSNDAPPAVSFEEVWRLVNFQMWTAIESELLSFRRDPQKNSSSVYELSAVIMHCGSAYAGHYFAYIRDCTNTGNWSMPSNTDSASSRHGKSRSDQKQSSSSLRNGTVTQDSTKSIFHSDNFRQLPDKSFAINLDSPLGLLIRIVTEEGSGVSGQEDTGSMFLPVGQIGVIVKKHLRKSWKDYFGLGIQAFIGGFPSHLISFDQKKDAVFVWNSSCILKLDKETFFDGAISTGNESSGVNDSNTDNLREVKDADIVENDEEIAARLQRQFDKESDAVTNNQFSVLTTVDSITDDGEWIPVGTASKKVSKTSSSAVGKVYSDKQPIDKVTTDNNQKSVVEIIKDSATPLEANILASYNNIIDEVSQRLLNRAFGEFYVFNDSKVTPICLSTIAESFESTNSGYIVVYRKKQQRDSDIAVLKDSLGTVSLRPEPLCPVPTVSPLWREITGEENIALAQVRSVSGLSAEPDVSSNQVLVQVFVPSQLMLDPLGGSLLIPRTNASRLDKSQKYMDSIYVLANSDTSILAIKQAIWDAVSGEATDYELLVSSDTEETLRVSDQNKNEKVKSPAKSPSGDKKEKKGGLQIQSAWSVPLGTRPVNAVSSQSEPSAYFVPSSADNLSLNLLKLRGDAKSNYIGWIPIPSSDMLAKMTPSKSREKSAASTAESSVETLTIGEIIKSSSPQSATNKPLVSVGSSTVIDITNQNCEETKEKGISSSSMFVNLNMLLWNGCTIQNEPLRMGLSHEPRLFVVNFLVPGVTLLGTESLEKSIKTTSAGTSKQSTRIVRPFVESQVEIWISGTTPVSVVCQRAVKAILGGVELKPDAMQMHSVYVVETYGIANKNHAKEHAKGIYSKILWDASINGVVQAVKKDAVAKDLSGSELLVELFRPELISSKKNSETSAASALSLIESLFRNNEVDILFDVQNSLQKAIRHLINEVMSSDQDDKSSERIGNSSILQLQKEPNCDLNVEVLPPNITVDHTCLVFEMKWRLLKILIRHELLTSFSNKPQDFTNQNEIKTPVGSVSTDIEYSTLSLSSSLAEVSISNTRNRNHDDYISYCLSQLIDQVRIVSGVSDSVEATVDDESKTIVEHGLKDGAMVTLELGAVVTTSNSYILRCVPLFGNDPAEKLNPQKPGTRVGSLEVELSFNKNDVDHIEAVRLKFMELINKKISDMLSSLDKESTSTNKLGCIVPFDSQNCRLRVTNWAEESDESPLPEVSKEKIPTALNSFITSGKIKNRSLLILEVGNASVPGLCELEIYLWIQGLPVNPTVKSSVEGFLVDPFLENNVKYLQNISCSVDMPAVELQTEVFNVLMQHFTSHQDTFFAEGVAQEYHIPETIDHFVIREIRDDSTSFPGDANLEPVVITTTKPSVGRDKSHKNKLKKSSNAVTARSKVSSNQGDRNTIKKLKLHAGSRKLVVEIFSPPKTHTSSIPPTGSIYLWVYRGNPISLLLGEDGTKATFTHEPCATPINYILTGASTPTLPQLKRGLEAELGIAFIHQRIFKYISTDCIWKDITLISQKKKNAIDNLTAAPYLLKDGDILCVVDSNTSISSEIAPGGASDLLTVDRWSDVSRRKAIEVKLKERKASGVKKGRPQEISLKLTADFSSEDESDSGEEEESNDK